MITGHDLTYPIAQSANETHILPYGPIITAASDTYGADTAVSIKAVKSGPTDTVTNGPSKSVTFESSHLGNNTFVATVVDDRYGDTADETVTVVVFNPVTANYDVLSTTEGLAVKIAVADLLTHAVDSEGNPLTLVSIATTSSYDGTAVLSNGVITYTPKPGYVGGDAFEYTVTDKFGNTASSYVEMTVNAAPHETLPDIKPPVETLPLAAHAAVDHDFNGDGTSDILWRNDNGTVAIWDMKGDGAVDSTAPGTVSADWHLVGASTFDGDASSDLLWVNTNGAVAVWDMVGSRVAEAHALPAAPGTVEGIGGHQIFWEDGDHHLTIWDVDANVATAHPMGTTSAEWHIAAVGDFDGNGAHDILWRSDGGANQLWDVSGDSVTGSQAFGGASPDWHIAGVGNFEGNGVADILWHNDNGDVVVWDVNGRGLTGSHDLGVMSPDWKIAALGDFEGNGDTEILWRNDNGATTIWDVHHDAVVAAHAVANVPTDWHIIGNP